MALRFFQPNQKSCLGLDHFKDIAPLRGSHPQDAREQFIAREVISSRPSNSCYTNDWYILMREGKWGAEVEKAISLLYHFFLDYSTDINIVHDKVHDVFYVASRGVNNYVEWGNCFSKNLLSIDDDGRLFITQHNQRYPVTGLGELCALTEFFGESDSNTDNFGIQILGNKARAFKIDNEKALDFFEGPNDPDNNTDSFDEQGIEKKESIQQEIQETSIIAFKRDITQCDWFRQEKESLLKKIAQTDFKIIEKILRNTLSSNKIESARWLFAYFNRMNLHQEEKEKFNEVLTKLDKLMPENYDVNVIINKLRLKHTQLLAQYPLETAVRPKVSVL